MFRYTVIIPHKNCVPLLMRCYNSIPNRDDVQVVIVDDVSSLTPEESEQLKNFCSPRVQVLFMEKTQYAGGARNRALSVAEGRWLVFADADDFFTPEAFSVMDEWADSDLDMVFFCHESHFSDTLETTLRSEERNSYVRRFAHNSDDREAEDTLRYMNPVPWARMVRRELVEEQQIRFDCILAANDVMFALYAGYYAHRVAADNRATYCVTIRQGSLTRTPSRAVADCRYDVAVRRSQFFYDHNLHHMLTWLSRRTWSILRNQGFSEFLRYYRLARTYHVCVWKGLISSIRH